MTVQSNSIADTPSIMRASDRCGFSLLCLLAIASFLTLAACGPQSFESASAITIMGGKAPAPVKKAELSGDQIVIHEKVQFEFDKSVILKESFSLLQEVAAIMKEHEEIVKIRVEGHASNEGSKEHNLELSESRAKAVMKFLINRGGIAASRLEAKGYGESKPLESNATDEGKERNRRVEFHVVSE